VPANASTVRWQRQVESARVDWEALSAEAAGQAVVDYRRNDGANQASSKAYANRRGDSLGHSTGHNQTELQATGQTRPPI
jgi:hypothetical protein